MTESTGPLQRTPLFDFHAGRHAKLVPFGGWEMPLYYEGILPEHRAVRESAGLFDVGHMGILTVVGGSAASLLSHRTTCDVAKIPPGQVRYTFLLDLQGAIVDDLLITRVDDGSRPAPEFVVVPNAATAAGVFDLLRSHRRPDTVVARHNGAVTIVAVQGPQSRKILEELFGWSMGDLGFYQARWFPKPGRSGPPGGQLGPVFPAGLADAWWVSRTGYTGELGYELFVPGPEAPGLAETLVARDVRPCGLGARDTLRLEKGYLLSGQDFHNDRTPLEAGQDRFVDFDHAFVGKPVLEKQRADGLPAKLVGITVAEAGAIPRHGTPVLVDGKPAGTATSGGISPSLGHGIALAYLPPGMSDVGRPVALEIRGRAVPGTIVALPFLKAKPKPKAS